MAIMDGRIRSCLASGDKNKVNKAVHLAKSGASPEVLDLLIDQCMEFGWTDRVLELVQLDISSQTGDRLVAKYARKGKRGRNLGKLLPLAARGVSQDSVDTLADECLRRGWTQNALEMAALGASADVANRAIDAAVQDEGGRFLVDTLVKATTAAGRELTADERQGLVTTFVATGNVPESSRAAALRGTPLSPDELARLIAIFIEEGDIKAAMATAKLRGRPLSVDERSALMGNILQNTETLRQWDFEHLLEFAAAGVTTDIADALLEEANTWTNFNLVLDAIKLGVSQQAFNEREKTRPVEQVKPERNAVPGASVLEADDTEGTATPPKWYARLLRLMHKGNR